MFLQKAPSSFSLCRYPSLVKNVFIAGFLIAINNYVYYGSIFGLEALKGNIYFNSIFSCIADLLGICFISCTLSHFRRKVVFITTLLLTVFASFSFYFIKLPDECSNKNTMCWQKFANAILAGLIKGISGIFSGNMYVYISEIFPSEFRAIGISFVTIIGRVGNIVAPISCNL